MLIPFRVVVTLFCSVALCSCGLASDGTKPNVVIVFIDDLGYGDIGPFGATKQKTPSLDRMQREGMKLTSFYAAPVCSVSRAQLLTGCYGARISVPGVYHPAHQNGLNPEEITIAERLKDQGYATMCVGKWHLGDQPEFLPTNQGFDHYFGIPYSNDMQRASSETGARVVPLLRDDKVVELLTDEQQSRIVERYTDEAVQFIKRSKDKPFLLYFPHTAVHTPIWPGEAFRGKSANGRFGDWVEEVDWSVGRVLDTLVEMKLDKNTLVIFTSDNGPWLIKGTDGGNAGPLRGGKGSTWEGGVRVPTLAWWPGKIAPGSICDAVAGTIDLLPTAVSLAGGSVKDGIVAGGPVLDGHDISPLLLGHTTDSPRETHYYFSGYNLQAIRRGPWKLAIATQPDKSMDAPVSAAIEKGPRLYHLDQEIGEQTNLAAKHPEVVAQLTALAEKKAAEIGGNSPSARRPAGYVENPQLLYDGEAAKARAKQPTKRRAVSTNETAPVSLDDLRPGDILPAAQAPQVAERPFEISCDVQTDQLNTIIIAHGGVAVGYALYIKEGRVNFLLRNGAGDAFTEIASPVAIDKQATIVAKLASDATMTLQVGEQATVTANAKSLLGRQPQEDFCLGHDNSRPVATYVDNANFKGRIANLRIVSQ